MKILMKYDEDHKEYNALYKNLYLVEYKRNIAIFNIEKDFLVGSIRFRNRQTIKKYMYHKYNINLSWEIQK